MDPRNVRKRVGLVTVNAPDPLTRALHARPQTVRLDDPGTWWLHVAPAVSELGSFPPHVYSLRLSGDDDYYALDNSFIASTWLNVNMQCMWLSSMIHKAMHAEVDGDDQYRSAHTCAARLPKMNLPATYKYKATDYLAAPQYLMLKQPFWVRPLVNNLCPLRRLRADRAHVLLDSGLPKSVMSASFTGLRVTYCVTLRYSVSALRSTPAPAAISIASKDRL